MCAQYVQDTSFLFYILCESLSLQIFILIPRPPSGELHSFRLKKYLIIASNLVQVQKISNQIQKIQNTFVQTQKNIESDSKKKTEQMVKLRKYWYV